DEFHCLVSSSQYSVSIVADRDNVGILRLRPTQPRSAMTAAPSHAFGQMPVAHQPLVTVVGQLVGMHAQHPGKLAALIGPARTSKRHATGRTVRLRCISSHHA